jgi:probable F420-dependent oxidoreductase
MVRPFRFGLQAMELSDEAAVRAAAEAADQLGYVQFLSFDHVGAVDPFVPLMVAAAAAPRLEVGPLVLNNELHHPALLARTAASVDRLTGGRLVLGLGTGYMSAEHDAIGATLREPGPRVRRLAESIAVLRALLDVGSSRFEGEFHHLALDDLGIRPTQPHVPFLIGGHGRVVVKLAASHADIFQFTGLVHGPGGAPSPGGFALADIRARARWLAEAAGDRADDIELSALVQVTHVGSDADRQLRSLAERFRVSPELIDETPFALVGSLAQVVDKVERLRAEVGISHLVVRDAAGFAPVVAALAGR